MTPASEPAAPLLRTSEDPKLYNRAAYDPAPEEVWLDVIDRYPDMKVWVVRNKTVPLNILEILIDDPDDRVRHTVATKRKLTLEMFEKLATDPDEAVRNTIACNKKTPLSVLKTLCSDSWSEVSEHAQRRIKEMGEG